MVNASVNFATRGLGVAVIFILFASGCFDDGEKAQSCSIDSNCSAGEICSSDLCLTGIRPAVGEQSPLPGAIAVAIDAPITFGFTTPMDKEATESNLRVTQGAEDVSGTIAWSNGDQSLVFTPLAPWNYNTVNNVRLGVGATSQDGHSLAVPVSFEFTTDIPRASILQTIPVDGATGLGVSPLLSLHFSEPMEPETKSQVGLTDSSGELPLAVAAYWNENATVLYIMPTLSLSSEETYILTAPKDLSALSGNPLDAEYQVSFSIGEYSDTVAPSATIDSIEGPIAIADLTENTLLLSGTSSDDSGVEWVGVEVVAQGDSPAGEWLQATTTETGWSYAWKPLLLEPQPQGNYDVYTRVVDSAGNATEVSTSLLIDVRAPLTASFAAEFPDSWKFKTLSIAVIAEEGASLAVTQDDVPLEGSPFTVGSDDVALTLTLPEIGFSATLQFLVTDAAGNPAAETVTQVVQRTGYSCLSAANGFPVPDVEVVSQADDEEGAVQITYRLGEGEIDDTYINSSGGSGVNHGIEQYIGVGMSPDNKWLMRLPDSFFPTCATIVFAKVSYQVQPSSCENCPSPTSLDAFVLLRDWDEREVTWDEASLGVSWENAGASGVLDTETLPIGLMVEEESGPVFSIELTSLAQLWANAKIGVEPMSENRGLLLYPSESGTRTIYSSETGSSQLRPILELNFVESP